MSWPPALALYVTRGMVIVESRLREEIDRALAVITIS